MHTLKLRQRVKDVQAKVFKRRPTNERVETAAQVPTSSSATRLESLKKRPSIVSLAASSLSRRRAAAATTATEATTPTAETTPTTPTASIEGEVDEQEQKPWQTVVEEEESVEDRREEPQHQADPTTTATTTTITSSTTPQDHKEAKSPSIGLARTNAGEQEEELPKQQHEHHHHHHNHDPSLPDPPSPSPSSSSTSSPQPSSRPRSPHQQNPPPSTSSSQSTASPSSPIAEEHPSSQPIQLPASGSHEPSTSSPAEPPLQPQKCTSPAAPSRSSSVTRPGLQFRLPFSDQPTIPESSSATGLFHRPSQLVRRQSLLPATETKLIHALWNTDTTSQLLQEQERDDKLRNFSVDSHNSQSSQVTVMPNKKIWVRRAVQNSSPTGVSVGEEDLVDDVRDAILRKYGNSLGRSFDSPDINLRIYPRPNRNRQCDVQRHHGTERLLGPDEVVMRILDEYFPGGQGADEALVIEIPIRRTPRPSPQQLHYPFDQHMADGTGDYFSVPITSTHSQGTPVGGVQTVVNPQSISVLNTGQVPIIPGSPGRRATRPGMGRRVNTSSPTMHSNSSTRKTAAERETGPITLQPRKTRSRGSSDATPPERMQEQAPNESPEITPRPNSPAPIRVSSPPPAQSYKKQEKPESPLGHTVPPIKVLIVEDNSINLRLLEAFMKRLRVRWETAMNGRIAVDKWKAGGFHLVLMDIQLPVMSGLEATKEIRRLERVNQIGIKPLKPLGTPKKEDDEAEEDIPPEDRLGESILFRSPVIIVALTASSLTSDRHEAYAAGCNDFLTKVCSPTSPACIQPS